MTMTESQRRRLTEFLGHKWFDYESCPNCGHYCTGSTVFCTPPIPNRTFTTWNETMPLLARLVEVGEYWPFNDYASSVWAKDRENMPFTPWLFQSPERFATLVADYLEVRDGLSV